MLCEYRYPYGSSYSETGCMAARFSGDRLVAESVFMDHPRPGADDPGDMRAHAGRARWGPAADGPDAAVDFAGFAGSMRVQTELWAQHGGQPSPRRAWLDLAGTDPFFRDLLPAMETSVIRPRFSAGTTCRAARETWSTAGSRTTSAPSETWTPVCTGGGRARPFDAESPTVTTSRPSPPHRPTRSLTVGSERTYSERIILLRRDALCSGICCP